MFQSINGWITGPIRRDKALAGLFFLVLAVSSASPAESHGPFERAAFSRIEFSDACANKQWLLGPDNTLQLLMTPPSRGVCTAALHFYFPQETAALEAIGLEARGTQPGAFLRVGIQEKPGDRVIFSRGFPRGGLGTEWVKDGARIRQLRPGFNPSTISTLYFVAVSNRSMRAQQPTVMIRRIRLTKAVPAAPVEQPVTPPVEPARVETPVQTFVSPTPAASSTVIPWIRIESIAGKVFLAVTGLLLLAFALKNRGRRRRILSPLYEINMRIWKTRRDENEVVQFGGFQQVTANDLKVIKQEGFNTLWLMGIWEIGAKVLHISKDYASDFHGSPFAIYDYRVSPDLGSEQDFRELVRRAHSLRLSVIVDFIPNHMGLDSAWLNEHPEYFMHKPLEASDSGLSDDELKAKHPGFFPYRTPSYPQGNRRIPRTILVAYGKDPYFYPWIDTAQLDYAQPGLRKKMIDTLCYWARIVDGVRCDMAMLALRDQVKNHRHPDMSWEAFNQLMPNEFWTEAIHAVKRVNPNFVFMAETYWSMEGFLQNLGFDYTYNKPLYEAICSAVHSGHAEGLMNFLRLLGTDFLQRSVHFLENHDEERAINTLGEERQKAAGAILCTLPGIALLHQGQMEGKRERLPVQRVIPQHHEPENTVLRHFYRSLLKATSLPVFQEGRLIPLYSNNSALACYARVDETTKVLVVVNTSQTLQKGSVFLMPGLRLNSGTPYHLSDLFYPFKANNTGRIQPYYIYPGATLINQGLYVELDSYDSHIFVVDPQGVMPTTQKILQSIRQTLEEWPLNRVARRVLGAAFTRSSDVNLAANPTGRQS